MTKAENLTIFDLYSILKIHDDLKEGLLRAQTSMGTSNELKDCRAWTKSFKKGAKRAVSCGFQPGRADGGIACAAVYDLVCRIRVV